MEGQIAEEEEVPRAGSVTAPCRVHIGTEARPGIIAPAAPTGWRGRT